MKQLTLLTIVALCASSSAGSAALAEKWKPHPVTVLPGVPMRAADIKPYVAPNLGPEPTLEPSETGVVEVTVLEAAIELRPGGAPLAGNAIQGARLPIKGQVKGRGCSGKPWYALDPFGYLCSRDAKPTDLPATAEQVLKVKDGERLPFHYVMVLVKEGDKVPLWTTFDALKRGDEPERQLEHGDTIAVERPLNFDGERYWLTAEGKVMPQKGASMMGPGSAWHGIPIDESTTQSFGWITPDHAPVYNDIPEGKAEPATNFDRRARVKILDEQTVGKKRWLKVAMVAPPPEPEEKAKAEKAKAPPVLAAIDPPHADSNGPEIPVWVNADQVNEVRVLARPATVPADIDRWIDVDLGEQVLVLYENDKPVFATLVSSGRAIPTPMGTYPVWAKVAAITMKNQPYEDKGYFVNKVPWSTFFQWHNAIHGAYWHDRFGVSKSHGCVNVAPLDARHVFEWVSPPLPPGWSGLRPADLLKSPYVVVRNSHAKKQFRQDRPIGPPDRELEGQRLEEAEKRRADEAALKTATPPATPDPAQAPPAP